MLQPAGGASQCPRRGGCELWSPGEASKRWLASRSAATGKLGSLTAQDSQSKRRNGLDHDTDGPRKKEKSTELCTKS
ncbi:hypothetical protein I7I53_03244 [Histoplasma capsulatum var. duboisii H88]|uniref:Uncharacterized protein n=1 Tax=Ajellomyces capsulatus (strain H88) TaxID=544711 RepID=A0A8A1LTI4_AJEC8|nr:hypothetical protein I7I53_03244 [Histoplasma capsulatum var. duboisii H88]